jgi:hypothetical protein
MILRYPPCCIISCVETTGKNWRMEREKPSVSIRNIVHTKSTNKKHLSVLKHGQYTKESREQGYGLLALVVVAG